MEAWRDGAIILLAVFSIIQALSITALAVIVAILVRTLHVKVVPLIDRVPDLMDTASATAKSVEGTAKQVQTTTVFATEKTVKPLITAVSYLAGAQATARSLANVVFGTGGSRGRK